VRDCHELEVGDVLEVSWIDGVDRKLLGHRDGGDERVVGVWRDRLRRYESPATSGVVAWCPEVHDLWLSKAAALRPKDIEFCDSLLASGLVDVETLRGRLDDVSGLDGDRRTRIEALIDHSTPEP
jgi:hypothetical protein